MAIMRISLREPEVDSVIGAGVFGLMSTLMHFDRDNVQIDGLNWRYGGDFVELDYDETRQKDIFKELFEKSFILTEQGIIRFVGVEFDGDSGIEFNLHFHKMIKNISLQQPSYFSGVGQTVINIGEDGENDLLAYFQLRTIKHQTIIEDFLDNDGELLDYVPVSSAFYPGASHKHISCLKTKIKLPVKFAICLLYTPIACGLFEVKNKAEREHGRYIMVVPHIVDLIKYYDAISLKYRSIFRNLNLTRYAVVSGVDDALIKFYAINMLGGISDSVEDLSMVSDDSVDGFTVISYGKVAWNNQTMPVVDRGDYDLEQLEKSVVYVKAEECFPNMRIKIEKGEKSGQSFVSTSLVKDLIARNLVDEKNIVSGFSRLFLNKDIKSHIIYHERRGVMKFIREHRFDDDGQEQLIKAVHEAWYHVLGKKGDRADKENASFERLVEVETNKLRARILKARSYHQLSEALHGLWKYSGKINAMANQEKVILNFITRDWRLAKDTVLFALLGYDSEKNKKQKREEEINE